MAEGEVRVSWWGLTKADRGSLSVIPNDAHQCVLYVSAAQGENLAVAVVAVAKDLPTAQLETGSRAIFQAWAAGFSPMCPTLRAVPALEQCVSKKKLDNL